ncbi:tryptophan synthase subunit alpha [Methylobacillus flagellatus]|uniref:Tryptophan synthase alpha chain n=1 Tax=Methylobacillus flagellatus (strain ATCC 51484 / DSM 6875 / VKM B-1610 / KT) TaxID=265072 RepID=Q1H0M2_METFK|nr:tryptophan synthase subunit alpha [Methylobacillus flagellatus]ABE49965.1 tryptophan synthase, alpha chain [Methylobacillus flagellatus KT]
MSRIQATFATLKSQGKKALIPYITAGDPHPKHTVALMHALVQAGSDIIELGVPFSDPMADGPVIQCATERALAHKVGLINVLEMVREFRRVDDRTPVVLMGYANPIEAMGQAKFAERACAAGVDGVLTVDYPPEECQDFVQLLKSQQLDPIFLLSPTSDSSRVDMIVHQAAGFVYYVSLKGVTGSQNIDIAEVGTRVKAIRSRTDLPVGVGFGVRDAATAKAVAEIADAVVIGSRMIQEIENSSEDALLSNVAALTQSMRTAIDDAKT